MYVTRVCKYNMYLETNFLLMQNFELQEYSNTYLFFNNNFKERYTCIYVFFLYKI